MRTFITMINLTLLPLTLLAQDDFTGFTNYPFTVNGFKVGTVFSTYHDPNGYMWISTLGGLDRWDGVNLKRFPIDRFNPRVLSDSYHGGIILDKTGKYWVNTHSCLSVIDPRLPIDSSVTRIYSIPNRPDVPHLTDIAEDIIKADEYGNLWLAWGAQNALLHIQPDKTLIDFKRVRSEDNPQEDMAFIRIQPDSVGHHMWLTSQNHGFCSMSTTDFTVTHYEKDVKRELMRLWNEKEDIIKRTIYFWSKQGFVWCCSANKPFTIFDIKTRKASFYQGGNNIYGGQPESAVENYYEDYKGNCWFTNYGNGVQLMDMAERKCISYKHDDQNAKSISGNWIRTITGDRLGNIWFSQINSGVSSFNYNLKRGNQFYPFGKRLKGDEVQYYTHKLSVDGQGNEYIRNLTGFFIKPVGEVNFQKIGDFPGNTGNYYASRTGIHYHASSKGIFEFSAHPIAFKKHPVMPPLEAHRLLDSLVFVFHDDLDGEPVLWMTHSVKGLYRYFINQGKLELVSNDPQIYGEDSKTNSNIIRRDSKNNLWLMLAQGFARFNLKTKTWTRWLYTPNDPNFMAIPPLYDLIVDAKDRVWFVSSVGGCIWFDGEKFHNVSRQIPGVPLRCNAIKENKNGDIWFSNNRHVVRYKPETGQYKLYPDMGGANQLMFKNDSIAIFSRRETMAYIPIEEWKKVPPKTIISDLRIFETDRSDLLLLNEIVLPHDQNSLRFSFGNSSYTNAIYTQPGQFAWQLEGIDKDWVQPKEVRTNTAYTALPHGTYIFKVKAANTEGVWDEIGASVKIKILPPWYKTWWFRLLFFSAIAYAIYWFFQQRTKQLLRAQRTEMEKEQALERERTRIARDMHDDISSGLSAINLLANYVQNNPLSKDTQTEIKHIAQSSTELNQRIREIIWAVSSDSDNVEGLVHFIRRYVSDFGEMHHIDVRFDTPENVLYLKLSNEAKRNLFLCVKEALNNIAKYAQATLIEVSMEFTDNKMRLTVKDNGIGFDLATALKNGGNGLKNIQERMKQIGGEALFINKKGSEMTLKLHLS